MHGQPAFRTQHIGNDPLPQTGVEMLPVDAMVEPVLGAIETGRFEVSVPDWFNQV